ncbi:MAG: hypothetical protein AAF355_05375 [Myxococcota bacterium]
MRIVFQIGLVVFGFATVIGVRSLSSSRDDLLLAESYEVAGDLEAAALHYRRAIRWYLPGSPFAEKAVQRLVRLAREADRQEERLRALRLWRSLRAAILSIRSTYLPFPKRVRLANERIASLVAMSPESADARSSSYDQRLQLQRRQLSESIGPAAPALCVLLAGFLLWLCGLSWFAMHGLDESGRLKWRLAVRSVLVSLFGFTIFAVGMILA